MSNKEKLIYEFGPFHLDVMRQLFLRDGQPVHLKPKIFDLLVALVQSDGRILTKETLMQQLWPNSFVEEGNLAVSIFALRKALGDNHDKHLYIETIPRRGYRFIANVRKTRQGRLDSENSTHVESNASDVKDLLSDPKVKSIAVLPLKFIGIEADDEYLGLGLADALITKLGSLRQVDVRATSAVRRYAGREYDPVVIGRELKVDYVLEGNIRRAGERVRVTVQLVSIKDGVTCWAEKFDEWFTDILFVEDSISQQVAEALFITLTGTEKRLLTKHQTINAEAYQAYMKGRFFCNKKTRDTLTKSVEYFKQAIKLDGSYAQPFVGLADAYLFMSDIYVCAPKAGYMRAKRYISKALRIDSNLAEVHATLGLIKMSIGWDWIGAMGEFKQAIQINPNYATAYQWHAICLRNQGRFDEALREANKALELEPTSINVTATRAFIFYYSQQFDKAITELEILLEMDRNYPIAYFALGLVYTMQGRFEEAVKKFQEMKMLAGINHPEAIAACAYVYAVSGRRVEADELLHELTERAKTEYLSPYYIATIYFGLGEIDQAFRSLERSYWESDLELCRLKIDPRMEGLRTDERYVSLLQRIGLTTENYS